jgi:hypothetical protein
LSSQHWAKNLKNTFMQKTNFEEYRGELFKKIQKSQNYLKEVDIYEVDHPRIFMTSNNNDRRQVLISRIIWDGNLYRFK